MTATVRDDKPISLRLSCQPSGGAHGSDARSTFATNTDRRALTPHSRLNRRPDKAKRRPKVTAARPDRASLTASANPRKLTNPGNRPTIVKSRSRHAVQLAKTPKHLRPLERAIF